MIYSPLYSHVAVDAQSTSLLYLQPHHRKEFVEAETAFVKRLRDLFVPTVWSVIDQTDHMRDVLKLFRAGKVTLDRVVLEMHNEPSLVRAIPMMMAWPSDPAEVRTGEQLAKYYLSEMAAKRDEIIHARSKGDNAFDNERGDVHGKSVLDQILKQTFQTERVVITGLNSSECVAGTIFGALIAGYECDVIIDLVADRAEQGGKRDRVWHEMVIISSVMRLIAESDFSEESQDRLAQAAIKGIRFKTSDQFIDALQKRPAALRTPLFYGNDGGSP